MSVTPTLVSLIPQVWGNNVAVYTWAAIANGEAGVAISGPGFTDRSVQIEGTFGTGGTVVIEGSNDSLNYHTLHDPFSNALSYTSSTLVQVTEICLWMRPRVTAGDGTTSINVTAICCNHENN